MGKMRRIGENIDGAATVGRAPNGRSALSGGDWATVGRALNGKSALSGGDWRPSDASPTGKARLAAAIGDRRTRSQREKRA